VEERAGERRRLLGTPLPFPLPLARGSGVWTLWEDRDRREAALIGQPVAIRRAGHILKGLESLSPGLRGTSKGNRRPIAINSVGVESKGVRTALIPRAIDKVASGILPDVKPRPPARRTHPWRLIQTAGRRPLRQAGRLTLPAQHIVTSRVLIPAVEKSSLTNPAPSEKVGPSRETEAVEEPPAEG
jgi:hypothetical protein